MQKTTKFFLYIAMISFACVLAGLTLNALDHRFPTPSPANSFLADTFISSTEGLTLLWVGLVFFVASSVTCLILSAIQNFRRPGSSA